MPILRDPSGFTLIRLGRQDVFISNLSDPKIGPGEFALSFVEKTETDEFYLQCVAEHSPVWTIGEQVRIEFENIGAIDALLERLTALRENYRVPLLEEKI